LCENEKYAQHELLFWWGVDSKTLIRPVATYGAESWPMSKNITKWLATFEKKVLRRLGGGIKGNKNGESNIIKN
jgi:hypothetical protein